MRILLFILFFLFQFLSHAQMDSLSYKVITKKGETLLKPSSRITIKAKPFSLQFYVPKDAETIINIQGSFDSAVYLQHLKGDSLSHLTAWKSSNAMAVAIKTFSGLYTSLNLRDESRQPYVHDGMHFTSFNHIDSTNNWLRLTLDFDKFVDVDGIYFKEGKDLSFKKAKGRSIYLLMEVIITPKNGKRYQEEVPFVLFIK